MRIVAGKMRGLKLADLGAGDVAAALRPTSDRVRESVFNLLAHGGYATPAPPIGMQVLDLFAGTGAMGLEALSRGAASVTFVENGKVALATLRANVARARIGEATRIVERDATGLGRCEKRPFDLAFLDPPYARGLGEAALASARAGGWLAPGALVVWEERETMAPPPGLTALDARRYGGSMISILRHDPE